MNKGPRAPASAGAMTEDLGRSPMQDANTPATPTKADPTAGHTPTPWQISTETERGFAATIIDREYETIANVCRHRLHAGSRLNAHLCEASANAALVVRAVNNHDPLIDELAKAHRIILNALNLMTPTQKHLWGAKNAADECDGEGTTRFHERDAVLDAARGEA